MDAQHSTSAERHRRLIEAGLHDPQSFRASLLDVPPSARDAWLDLVLGISEVPDDGPELPRGCVPYWPCNVDVLIAIIDAAAVGPSDVFVDIGSGIGRAGALVHLLAGASVIGIEIQSALSRAARDLAARLKTTRVATVEGDATTLTGYIMIGSVFFLYCPFSGERLGKVLAELEAISQTRTIRICTVDVPLPECAWLTLESGVGADNAAIYRSNVVR